MISIIRMLLPARLKGRGTPASGYGKMGKITGKNMNMLDEDSKTQSCVSG